MKKIITVINRINEIIGNIVIWASVLLILVITIDVIIRYIFDFTYIWITEVETYLFAFMFLLSSGYALLHDKHVRIDVFYANYSEKNKAWVNFIGGVLLLSVWCYIVIVFSFGYAYTSYLINERSAQPGGLPYLFILKSSIPLGFIFLLLQGISNTLNSLQIILKK